jgi:hypothetical protein
MLNSLERLQKLIVRPSHTYRPTIETFPNLDTQFIAEDMQLTEKGNERGQADQPPTTGKSLDQVENDIIEHVSAAQKRAHDAMENHLDGFRKRLIELDFETQFSNIRAASLGGLADLKQELQIGLDELHEVRRDLTEQEAAYTNFKKKHRLYRPSKTSSPRATFFKIAVVILLLLGEFIANGALLAEGSELGLVGGILEALIFSAVNVGGALFFAVFLIPFFNHRNVVLKILGFLSFLSFLAYSLTINLGLAHYRELPERVGGAVMERLYTRPFILEDFESWLLFALGILFSLVAMIDGLTFRDTYPGFSYRDKALRAAREKYVATRRMAIENLGDIRRQYEDAMTAARGDLGKLRGEHDSIVAHRLRFVGLFDEHQSQLEKAANALLRVYRDANIAIRSTKPPTRFDQKVTLDRVAVSVSKEGEWNETDLRERIAAAQAEVDELFVTLNQTFNEAIGRYRELDNLAPEQA